MSIYTTQLRWIVERKQHEAGSDPNDYSACYQYLGLSDYPIFDENYRHILNDKIIRHFYFREIGFETAAQFAFFLRRTMHEHMPYFNQLYNSLNIIEDPITNRKYSWSETYELAQGGSTTSEKQGGTTTDSTRDENVTDETSYGKVDTNVLVHGKTDTETDTYGKTMTHSTETQYGRITDTENGGTDSNTEGGIHERVIRSDTPMNQISNSGVENLNYATEVTYTDREGTSASETTYGGTTHIENDGSDVTDSTDTTAGTDTKRVQTTGTDTDTSTLSGKDTKTIELDRIDHSGPVSNESGTTTRDLDEHGGRSHNVSGYDGTSPADLLMKWRETFINVDMQVIASLETLFFGLWM